MSLWLCPLTNELSRIVAAIRLDCSVIITNLTN
nr:MAG TPA: hypothetical protein [Caudoviricetes sp.]